MLHAKLIALGFTKEESLLYVTLLQYGTQPASALARITGTGRVNTYHHLQKLIKKSLVISSKRKGVLHYTAEPPRAILNDQIIRVKTAEEILPELTALSTEDTRKPKIELREGKEGIKKIFDAMLEQRGGEIVSFSNFEKLEAFLPNYLQDHFQERIKRKIKTRFITPRVEKAEAFVPKFFPSEYDKSLVETFFISPEETSFESDISIFNGFIAILNLNQESPVGVLIENPQLYHTQKAIFDLAWLGATSFIT